MIELTTIYTYDNLNRVVHEDYSDGTTVDYAYDDMGRIACKIVRRPDVKVMLATEDTQPIDVAAIKAIVRRELRTAVTVGERGK